MNSETLRKIAFFLRKKIPGGFVQVFRIQDFTGGFSGLCLSTQVPNLEFKRFWSLNRMKWFISLTSYLEKLIDESLRDMGSSYQK